jgi:ADP-dependent NAD(P)H-hydrate dehydratase / NAD(P)H-hydrate epimerase
MTELLTSAQMRAVEQAAMDSGAVTGLGLMERAGQGVIDAAFSHWPELAQAAHRALVLCGPGNNGGDGFVIARLLKDAGWEVDLFLFGDADKLPPDAKANYTRWTVLGGVLELTAKNLRVAARPDLIVDAVFGTGLTRPLPPKVQQALAALGKTKWNSRSSIRRIAVDCPSGLNLDTGMVPQDPEETGGVISTNLAQLTVTFHTPKPGHYLGVGPLVCGAVVIADIGLRKSDPERSMLGQPPDDSRARLVTPVFAGSKSPPRIWPGSFIGKSRHNGHKFDHGHVMVFAGGVGRGGAGRLAARAALRSGAGVVTLLCPPSALIENACQLDAIMLRPLAKDAPLSTVADDRVTAYCIGPGLGVNDRTRDLVGQVLAQRAGARAWRDPAVVLDADALGSFADDPAALFAQCHPRTVLTPHEGEFARLFPDLALSRRDGLSKIDVARQAAERAGCIVLLKGADTVIATPEGGASVHAAAYDRRVPWLATAGAGDVLAGLIAGLAASDNSAELITMAEIAAYLHVECAASFGPGLIAEDLPEELPKVFRAMGL